MSSARVPVLAIDGPSGSGKGTVSRRIAALLGWNYLDSGALYRVVALAARKSGIELDDVEGLAQLAIRLDVSFENGSEESRVMLDAIDVSDELRTEAAGEAASRVARHAQVRAALLERQRRFAEPPGLVADGRDMGTVVFPDASCKVFLTASPEERARRRHKQLKDKGINVSLPALATEIAERDSRDASRAVAPLKAAQNARMLDSTGVSVTGVVEQILAWLRDAGIDAQSE